MTDRLAHYTFLVLGVGVLVPWNAFISAVPYFQLRICTLPNASQHFESWVGFLFNLSSVIALVLLMAWPWIQQQRRRRGHGQPSSQQQPFMGLIREEEEETDAEQQPTPATAVTATRSQEHSNHDNNDGNNAGDGHSSSYWLVTLPFLFYLGVFFVTDLLVLPIPFSPFLFLTLTLMSMMICGACAAIGGAGIVAFAGQYYPANIGINPFVSGQAVGGVIVSAANFISAMAEDPNLYWQQYCHATNYTADTGEQDGAMWDIGNNHNFSSSSSRMTARLEYDPYNNNSSLIRAATASSASVTATTTCPPYETLDRAVFLYFLVGAVVLLCCIIGFRLLHQSTRQQQQQQFPPPSSSVSLSVAPLQPHPLQDQPGDEGREIDGNQDGDDDGEATDALETFQDEAPYPRSGLELRESHRHPLAAASATHEKQHPRQQTHTNGTTDTTTTSRTAMMIDRQPSYHEDDGPVTITACRLPSNCNSSDTCDDDPTGTVGQSHIVSSNFDEISITSAHHNDIFKAVKGPAFCIFLTFFVTLSLFPSWTSTLKSIHQCTPGSFRVNNDLFTPMTFLLFNIGDLGGRLLAGIMPAARMRNVSTKLVVAACLRYLFFPMLLICVGGDDAAAHVHADDNNKHLLGTTTSSIIAATGQRMQIESDVYSILVQSLFALSNGFLISLAFMHAPTLIPATPSSQEKSSEIMTLALSFGLMCGSLFSFVVSKLV